MYQQPVKTTTELIPNTDDLNKSHADIISIPVLEINIPENELNSSIGLSLIHI